MAKEYVLPELVLNWFESNKFVLDESLRLIENNRRDTPFQNWYRSQTHDVRAMFHEMLNGKTYQSNGGTN